MSQTDATLWQASAAVEWSGEENTAMSQHESEVKTTAVHIAEHDKARQFDFWIGEWTLTWGDAHQGTNRIRSILDGHVIREEFDGMPSAPFRGLSISVYTPSIDKWRQTWVDNSGSYLDFVGGFADGTMILTRTAVEESPPALQRMVWFNIAEDRLDWNWERSEDSGASWQVQWAIRYMRRPTSDQPTSS